MKLTVLPSGSSIDAIRTPFVASLDRSAGEPSLLKVTEMTLHVIDSQVEKRSAGTVSVLEYL
jgi:hypothetical protein